jgi:hypothetical protein
MSGPVGPAAAGDGASPGTAPAIPAPYPAPVSSVTQGLDIAGTAPVVGIGMRVWLVVAVAGTLFILLSAAGVVLVLRHRDHDPAAEGGLSILDSPDPPAAVTFG